MQNDSIEIAGKRFHYFWLRDNCPCTACREPGSFQKIYDFSAFEHNNVPLSVKETEDHLHIVWDEPEPHRSRYSKTFLLHHAYDLPQIPVPDHEKVLWDARKIGEIPRRFHNVRTTDRAVWIDDLFRYGFTILTGFGLNQYEDLLRSLGPIHPTEYGDFAMVKAVQGANDLAETGYAITPHSDYSTYMHVAPLIQFLYCVENETEGGESILVDGFKVAEDFRKEHPDHFKTLVATPVQFQQFYTDWRFYFRRKRPVIELDEHGAASGVFFGHSHCYNWQIPFDTMKSFYEAYKEFYRYLKSPRYQYIFRLNKGECIVTWNSRTLHGRKAFSGNGARCLKVSYVSSDYLVARRQFQQLKHLYLETD